MRWSIWIRQTHRWVSVIFTAAVIVNGAAIALHRYTTGLGLLAVAPLAVLLLTGLYLFVLPYIARRRGRVVGGG